MKNSILQKAEWGEKFRYNDSFPEDNVEMFLSSYHHGVEELLIGERITVRKQWDEFELRSYLEYAKIDNELIESMIIKSFQGYMDAGNHCRGNSPGSDLKLYYGTNDNEAFQGSIYCVYGSKEKIIQGLRNWFEKAKQDKYWASGDDSFFDYTPDEVELFYQIACVVEAQDLWNEFYNWALNNWYNDGENPIENMGI